MIELLPSRTSYRPDEPIEIEVRGLPAPARLTVRRLGFPVGEVEVLTDGVVSLPGLPSGGYSLGLGQGHTAVEVVADPRAVLRYGFVVDFRPGRDLTAVRDNLRRLHLTGIQFYDWAYRHADLLGGGEQYEDALGQPVSLDTVRRLVETCHSVGADALGYAAVYGVGPQEWPKWEHDALLTASGKPYGLGDFLFLVDPAASDWLAHFGEELAAAAGQVGFDGFHLDQYGYPKHAVRPDDEEVDLADSFPSLIRGVRAAVPEARLVFNNVNDFPTWSTAPSPTSPQDAVYIEVWEPQVGLEHLAATVTRARTVAGGKPVVIAAYQHVYDTAPVAAADLATRFTMATLFSHGATHLLAGEADRILVDPYYVRNRTGDRTTLDILHRYYDFAVAHTELLFDPAVTEVTSSVASSYNDDLEVSYPCAAVDQIARAGTVWRRITRTAHGYAVHLINLLGQDDTHWDAARHEPVDPGQAVLRVRRLGAALPRMMVADPDDAGVLTELSVMAEPGADWARATLPSFTVWQLVLVDLSPAARRADHTVGTR